MEQGNMIKNYQLEENDCFRTCISCLLNVPAKEVPHFLKVADDTRLDYMHVANDWLKKNHQKRIISIELYTKDGKFYTGNTIFNRMAFTEKEQYVILFGVSPRSPREDGSPIHHAVIGQLDAWGFEVVHDPHESNLGIKGEPYGVVWIVPC